MFRRVILTFIMFFIPTNMTLADFKYTEETSTSMNMQMQGMPFNFLNNMMSNKQVETVYIKGSRKRVDKQNYSTITMCDLNQTVEIDNSKKVYSIKLMQEDKSQINEICKQLTDEKYVPPVANQVPSQGETVMKTKIIDTGLDEIIDNMKARKYLKEFSITGDGSCIPNMKTKEDVWSVDISPEDVICPLSVPNCNFKPVSKNFDSSCFNKMKIAKEGISAIPGFEIKKVMYMDMFSMMDTKNKQPPMFDGMGNQMTVTMTRTNISRSPLVQSLFEIPEAYTKVSEEQLKKYHRKSQFNPGMNPYTQ